MRIVNWFSSIKKRIHRWFNLGLKESQLEQYNESLEYNIALAKSNIESLNKYCKLSVAFVVLIMMLKCLIEHRWNSYYIMPFLISAVCFCILDILVKKIKIVNIQVTATVYRTAFEVCWYASCMYHDMVLSPKEPCVSTCIAFALLPTAFYVQPKENIIGTLVAYIALNIAELINIDRGLVALHKDILYVIIAMCAGIYLGQNNTRRQIERRLYMDMYKASTKTSILVAQIDIVNDTYEILRVPDYMEEAMKEHESAHDTIDVFINRFIEDEYKTNIREMLNFNFIREYVDDTDEMKYYFQDFRHMWCELSLVKQGSVDGKTSAIVALVRDIDDVRKNELEYQRQMEEAVQEARLANMAKTSFLRRMSHDIRTPINGIRGMLQIASHYPDDIDKQKECRDKIWEASGYLLSLVNNILDMNKLESGRMELENKKFDIREVIDEVNTVSSMQATENSIIYIYDEENSHIEHYALIGSLVHLKQILNNLISNAIKYNRKGGMVTVKYNEIEYDSDNDSVWIEFVCSDTGIGMSEEFQKNAFDTFSQEGRTTDSRYAGTGLGLSIVKELVELMNGKISLESEYNKGTRFTVVIPFRIDKDYVQLNDKDNTDIDVTGQRIMLVEDNELNMEIAEFIFESKGFIITKAYNGAEAVKIYKTSEPYYYSAIFMDIMMPVMNGIEATKAIRCLNREDAKKIPIIAMTANAFQDDINISREAGMNEHLMKPLEMDKIDAVIKKIYG